MKALNYLDQVKEDVLIFIESVRFKDDRKYGRWKYNIHAEHPYSIRSTAMAVEALWTLGEFQKLPEQNKNELKETVLSWQDDKTGYFIDPFICPRDRIKDDHSLEHNLLHVSSMALEILNMLGTDPLYPLHKYAIMELDQEKVEIKIRNFRWANPWRGGEHFSRAIMAYRSANNLRGTETDEIIERACRIIDSEIVNSETGFPDKQCDEINRNMAGVFKILYCYVSMGKPYAHPQRAIDSILAMQTDEGDIGYDNMCINWDSMWALKVLNSQLEGSYRFEEIAEYGKKLCDFIFEHNRKLDGAFSFFRDHCISLHNSLFISEPLAESGVMGTFMCLECFVYTEAWAKGEYNVLSSYDPDFRRRSGI